MEIEELKAYSEAAQQALDRLMGELANGSRCTEDTLRAVVEDPQCTPLYSVRGGTDCRLGVLVRGAHHRATDWFCGGCGGVECLSRKRLRAYADGTSDCRSQTVETEQFTSHKPPYTRGGQCALPVAGICAARDQLLPTEDIKDASID